MMTDLPTFTHRDLELPGLGAARLVSFELPGGVTTPAACAAAVERAGELFRPAGRGVIINGRGPIWAYAMMLHEAHATPWVATADPRLGAVIVQSHTPGIQPGRVIAIGE